MCPMLDTRVSMSSLSCVLMSRDLGDDYTFFVSSSALYARTSLRE